MIRLKIRSSVFHILLLISLCLQCGRSQSEIKGPPRAEVKVLKRIGHIGDNIKLVCPIEGFPTPLIEWTKGNEAIDFTWSRYKVNKKVLKIKAAEVDDTGVYGCKGINGFGSDVVRIELIVIDSVSSGKHDGDGGGADDDGDLSGGSLLVDLAPPIFTSETKNSPKVHRKSVGEAIQIKCEALGNPDPRMEWLKDGRLVNEMTTKFDGQSSMLEMPFLSAADSGTYTCRASNLVGQVEISFSIEVSGSSYSNGEGLSTVVTEAGPRNGSVEQDSEAVLFCRVKSLISPEVQWLKKLETSDALPSDQPGKDSALVLKVAGERFRMLPRDGAILSTKKIQNGEFIDQLRLKNVKVSDSGMYICFVTTNGLGQLTYKAVYLNVLPKTSLTSGSKSLSSETSSPAASSTTTTTAGPTSSVVITVVTCAMVFVVLTILSVVYVIRKRGSGVAGSDHSKAGSSADDHLKSMMRPPSSAQSYIVHESRPFLMLNNSNEKSSAHLQQQQQHQHLHQHSTIYSDVQPPLSSIGSQWSSTVYPLTSFSHHQHQQQQQHFKNYYAKSVPLQPKHKKNFDAFHQNGVTASLRPDAQVRLNGDYEFPIHCVTSMGVMTSSSPHVDRNNVYEVPYSHMLRPPPPPFPGSVSETQWSEPLLVNPPGLMAKLRPQPLGGTTNMSHHSIPVSSANNGLQHQQKNVYSADYESCYD